MPMYHAGKRPAGYVEFFDPTALIGISTNDGILNSSGRLVCETRQCSHCNAQWIYKPGSKHKYGVCLACDGYTCMKKECNEKCMVFEQRLDLFEKGKIARL